MFKKIIIELIYPTADLPPQVVFLRFIYSN